MAVCSANRRHPRGFDAPIFTYRLANRLAESMGVGCFAPTTRAGVESKLTMNRTGDIYIANLAAWCYSADQFWW
jgi:hypothetical protein